MADLGGFWNRIRRLFRQPKSPPSIRKQPTMPTIQRTPVVSPQPVVPAPTAPPTGPLDYAQIIQVLIDGGRKNRLVQLTYDGVTRLVEPYSFREKSTGRLFYGWCSIHQRIHSFKPEKISAIELTNQIFAPRFEIEL